MQQQEAYLSIGDLAARSGVHKETIRYYERIGLVPPPARTPGGHRLYTESAVRRLTFIRRGRVLGFSLDDIGRLLEVQDRGDDCKDALVIAEAQLAHIREQIAELQRLERVLAESTAACPGTRAADCTILNLLSDSTTLEELSAA